MSRRWFAGAAATAAAAALLLSAAPASATAAPRPSTVAKKLMGAWLRHDRAAAAQVAAPAAVATLFAYPYRAPDAFAGCSGSVCRFTHTSVRVPGGLNGVLMIVSGRKVVKVYESRHITRPSAVAAYFLDSWKRHDRYRALEVGRSGAVATLFRGRFDPHGVTYFFQGCNPEPHGYACAYSYEGGATVLHVRGSKSAGYEVRSVGFIAD
ncbi:hypothetical protein JOL79_01975 [Microbispora sp. RL4-1S]|uniref:Tat pathway signal protein n=1 Tax=Microbispora oryzae TaxID=2806554 RepID=A0A941AHX4_9ACTN|nr:hypothetical protein [Microbispora oryzae]MBP2702568.1 hypothetical protein [Microbispora oryzae]